MTAAGTPAGLAPVLKALGLSGILDTVDARLAEARAGTLGHAEFLQVLCEDELARRDAAKIARRIRAARFPGQATLEDFDFAYNPKLPAAQIRDLARLEFIAAGEGILAYGPVGVGKSHLAAALGHQACRRGHDVTFTTCSRLLAELAGGHADRSFEARVRKLAKITVLIVDDFAMREFTAAQADDLYELLSERLGRPGRSLILTSNRSPADWYPLFPNAVVGESILDRVLNTSHHLLLEGKSYRPRRRPGRPGPARRPAPAMTKTVAASPPLTPEGCRARAGGRAAQGYGAAPPASRLLRIADATALRAGLDPGDLYGPSGRKHGQAPACPARGAARPMTPCPSGPMTAPRIDERRQQLHHRHQDQVRNYVIVPLGNYLIVCTVSASSPSSARMWQACRRILRASDRAARLPSLRSLTCA